MTLDTIRKTVSLSLFAAAAVIVGCADNAKTPVLMNDNFRPDDEPRNVDNVFAQQRANGAREDGTFYAHHFTDGKLNSLGYQKLSAMAYGTEGGKMAVYIDIPAGTAYDAASDSVTKALTRGGFDEKRYTIIAGANPNVGAPAIQGINALAKQHGGEGEGKSDEQTINMIMKGTGQ